MFSAQRVESPFGAQMEMCGAQDRREALRRYSRLLRAGRHAFRYASR
jgi:hypothetical protein